MPFGGLKKILERLSGAIHQETSEILPRISGLLQRLHPSLCSGLSAYVQPPQERKVRTSTMEGGTGACILTAKIVHATRTSTKAS